MTNTTTTPATGLSLDAEAVRTELIEDPETLDLSTEQAAVLSGLSDHEINTWINEVAARDDGFWDAYDHLRRSVIARLALIHLENTEN